MRTGDTRLWRPAALPVGLVGATAALTLLARPHWHGLLAVAAAGAQGPAGAQELLARWAGDGAWLALGWLWLVALTGLGSALPGLGGRAAARLHRVVTPRALRLVVAVTLGVAPGALALPALAGTPPPVPLGWPVATGRPLHPARAPLAGPARSAPPRSAVPRSAVRVRPGDTLWSLTARDLVPGQAPAAVAQWWPRLWADNRAVIGADPDLIHPGQLLRLPTVTGQR
jgi:hypothetical protein